MVKNKRTTTGAAVTDLILDLFQVNNRMLTAGDRLVAELRLTSARWQVLGAIVAADRPQPVAWLARDMGANRQNVQRIVNDLEKEGLVAFEPNPHHRRAQLVSLSEHGKTVYDRALKLQIPWAESVAEGLTLKDIETARTVLGVLRDNLQAQVEDK
ncbi:MULTISPECIES: MarR family winged helix-turn-helix transcriptional regulator [unclassified Beijerinckia]|uniref:MarR family winged helix-turn-helix transcriptional regulator n=1 Tax=unclassified Beijerinckia TaxID=2638183 RepID=UPI00089B1E0D|nr:MULTISPECIES: MarR family winged helix-turn-helix transcriptional regulator [unclassified Beijerinckia]MDH7796226.1 DNA-binding MarR family transcriptional regulator [Beijerinckia sp. GAS462]SEC35901.1 transcriptional regulator, MarR family [Beijerinckia sp. 28-YEA-48]